MLTAGGCAAGVCATFVCAGFGVMYTIDGVALPDGRGAATTAFAVAAGRTRGEALAVGDAFAEADGAVDARDAGRAIDSAAVAVGA